MKPYEDEIFKVLSYNLQVSYDFPWRRLFEVEIELN